MKNTIKLALVGAFVSMLAPVALAKEDCYKISKLAAKEISEKPEAVLNVVANQIAANKSCACEIVKAAIVASEADKKLVAQIVEQAIESVPEKVSLLTTCALAVAPDAHAEVMEVAAKYSKNAGTSAGYSAKGYSSKGAKGGVGSDGGEGVGEQSNPTSDPLDFISPDPTGNFADASEVLPPTGQVTPGSPYSN